MREQGVRRWGHRKQDQVPEGSHSAKGAHSGAKGAHSDALLRAPI